MITPGRPPRRKLFDRITNSVLTRLLFVSILTSTSGVLLHAAFSGWREHQRSLSAIRPALVQSYYAGDYRSIWLLLNATALFDVHSLAICGPDGNVIAGPELDSKAFSPVEACSGKAGSEIHGENQELLFRITGRRVFRWSESVALAVLLSAISMFFTLAAVRRARKSILDAVTDAFRRLPQMMTAQSSQLEDWPNELQAVRDALQRSVNENRLLQTRLLEEQALAAEVAVAQQVAHDIRAPVAALKTAVAQGLGGTDDVKELVGVAITRIQSISESLLERVRGKKTTPFSHRMADSIRRISREVLFGIGNRKAIEVQYDIPTDLDVEGSLGVDVEEFERVMANLITNSVESIADTGTLAIKVFRSSKGIEVQIKDTGHGIGPEVLSKLGTKGFTHGKEGGTGLGLFGVKERVNAWGGKFEIQSEVGRGTLVSILFAQR